MVGIGTMLDKPLSSHFDFLPYSFVRGRGLDTSNPLEIRQNYEDIQENIKLLLAKYIENSIKEDQRKRNLQ